MTFAIIGILVLIFIGFQLFTTMATQKTETQAYQVIQVDKEFEIRYYPAAVFAKVTSSAKSYRDLGNSGFRTLANYIFGGNSNKKQIPMTTPVHMDIGDSTSSMAFVMPSNLALKDLPEPTNSAVQIETSDPEYVAAIQFGGFASTERIAKYKAILESLLKEKGISAVGTFRYLGYNPPYQLFGRRNEIIVRLNTSDLKNFNLKP